MFQISDLVTSFDHIPQVHPEDKLGAALEHTKSSHDIVLVFRDGLYLGILIPSFAFFKKRYPNETKVNTALIKSPKLTLSSSMFDVVDQMISLGAYTLPVFNDGSLSGLITSKSILKGILNNPSLMDFVKENVIESAPLLASSQTKVGEIYDILKHEHASRVVVVNGDGGIEGIITRRDIQEALVPPTRHSRFMKGDPSHSRTFSFDEEKIKRFDYRVTELYKSDVVTLPRNSDLTEIISKMLEEEVNSVVLVNFENKPSAIISIRNILDALARARPDDNIPIKVSDQHHILTPDERTDIELVMKKLSAKLTRFARIREIALDIDASQNRSGKITNFEIRTNILSPDLKATHATATDKKLMKAVKLSTQKLENQLDY